MNRYINYTLTHIIASLAYKAYKMQICVQSIRKQYKVKGIQKYKYYKRSIKETSHQLTLELWWISHRINRSTRQGN